MKKQQFIEEQQQLVKKFPGFYTGKCEFPKQPKSKGRSWELDNKVYTEDEILDHVLSKSIADGYGHYVVTKIPMSGKDPIVTLTHVEVDGDNYGYEEEFTRLSSVIVSISFDNTFNDIMSL